MVALVAPPRLVAARAEIADESRIPIDRYVPFSYAIRDPGRSKHSSAVCILGIVVGPIKYIIHHSYGTYGHGWK